MVEWVGRMPHGRKCSEQQVSILRVQFLAGGKVCCMTSPRLSRLSPLSYKDVKSLSKRLTMNLKLKQGCCFGRSDNDR